MDNEKENKAFDSEELTIQMDPIKGGISGGISADDYNDGYDEKYIDDDFGDTDGTADYGEDYPEDGTEEYDDYPEEEPNEDEVTEEEYQDYLRRKRIRNQKIKKKNRHRRTFSHIFAGILLSVFIISVSSFLAVYIIKTAFDFTGIGKTYCQAQVYIDDDSTTDDIAMQLANQGVITMPDIFKMYVSMTDKEDGFIKGTFTVDSTMSYSTLVSTMQTVTIANKIVTVTIIEGMTADDVAALLEEKLVCRAEDFLEQCKVLENTYKFQKRLDDEPLKYYQMEGYLFPNTYEFYTIPELKYNDNLDTTENAVDAANTIYESFNENITGRYYNRMSELGLTLDETITLASIVQREADSTENMKNVASVFFNRMADAEYFPRFESDVTVIYVDEHIKAHMSASDIKANQKMFDAYDTYVCDGIPVGPICNPGMDAIKAVLYPNDTDYYYFCADPETTEMYFAETIAEHEQNLIICGLEDAIADIEDDEDYE
ncbi:MAG: endolytic transglycosylase MltG [Eubacterium sp.]|nr:endolytic transglycosylase MltG [Eubacterium sp.]